MPSFENRSIVSGSYKMVSEKPEEEVRNKGMVNIFGGIRLIED